MHHLPRFALLGFAALVCAAQAPATTPQRTTATYEEWTLRCETQGTPAVKSCEILQAVNIQGQPNPITQVAIGRPAKNEPLRIVLQVPINIWLPAGAKLVYDDKEPPIAATYKRCLPAACFADADLKDDLLKKLRARTEPGRLEFKDAAQRDVAIPVSFKGLGPAYDALAKE